MKLLQIKCVLEVAKAKSINQAAKNLYLSQPYLSSTIKELERSLNITIFNRTTRGVELTAIGQEFVKSGQYVIEQIKYMEDLHIVHQFRDQANLMVVSNCTNSIANDIYIQLQKKNHEKLTRFYFKIANEHSIIQYLSNLTINVGLLIIPVLEFPALDGLLKTKKLVFNKMHEENAYVMVGRKCPLYYDHRATLDSCRNYPWVSLNKDWERTFNQFHLHDFQHIITVDDKESIFHTIATTDTIALGSRIINSASQYVNLDLIRFIPLDSETYSQYIIGWVQRKDSLLTPLENDFITLYEEYFQELNHLE